MKYSIWKNNYLNTTINHLCKGKPTNGKDEYLCFSDYIESHGQWDFPKPWMCQNIYFGPIGIFLWEPTQSLIVCKLASQVTFLAPICFCQLVMPFHDTDQWNASVKKFTIKCTDLGLGMSAGMQPLCLSEPRMLYRICLAHCGTGAVFCNWSVLKLASNETSQLHTYVSA